MFPNFLSPQKTNLSQLKNTFAPEIKILQNIAKNNISETTQQLTNMVTSKDEFKKVATKNITELLTKDSSNVLKNIEIVSEQLKSGANKTLELMKNSESSIIKETAKRVENSGFTSVETINSIKNIVMNNIQRMDKEKNEIEKDVIVEVIKTKMYKNFFNNIFNKIKLWVANLYNNLKKLNN